MLITGFVPFFFFFFLKIFIYIFFKKAAMSFRAVTSFAKTWQQGKSSPIIIKEEMALRYPVIEKIIIHSSRLYYVLIAGIYKSRGMTLFQKY